jgi:hypothetical protein
MHVPIGLYNLPVPLGLIIVAGMGVLAASFLLIYVSPPRAPAHEVLAGTVLPGWVPALLTVAAAAYVLFVMLVAAFGRQGVAALNAGALLFWVFTIPLLPLLHCVVGGVYAVANPFAAAARLLTGGRRMADWDARLEAIGYWPAVVMLFLLVMGESISVIVQSPAVLGYGVVVYAAFQVCMGMIAGEGWYRGGEVFQAITTLASSVAPAALHRDPDGRVRLSTGFDAGGFLAEARGREALITLLLAGVLADGVRATPIWRALLLPRTQPSFDSLGRAAGTGAADASAITLEIVVTWIAFAIFFWLFVILASWLSAPGPGALSRARLSRFAGVVSPSLIPIAVAYLLAHNLTQLLVVGPLIITARDAPAAQLGLLVAQQVASISPGWVWWVQVGSIVLGHVVAVVVAHARLARSMEPVPGSRAPTRLPGSPLGADFGWLSAMLVYTATSLWILAQPITAEH